MLKPKLLKKGDCIFILSTARFMLEEELDYARQLFENWGLVCVLGKQLFSPCNQFAGNDEMRAKDLQDALDDDSVKAIVCARGGYGTVRLLDRVDFTTFQKNPKWILGFSDVTAMHLHIHTNFSIPTLHGPMPVSFPTSTVEAIDSLHQLLFEGSQRISINNHINNRNGNASGELVGGNLSVMYSMLGSSAQPDTRNKILFLEDLDEYLYHIDRMMQAFKRADLLSNLNGLLIGGMTGMHDNAIPFGKNAEEIIMEAVSAYDYPVIFNVPTGHIDDNRSLYIGEEIHIDTDKDTTVLTQKYSG